MSNYIPVCKDCYTMNVVVDAWVVWDTAKNDWVIDGMSEESQCSNADCDSYEGDVWIDWVSPEDVKPTSQEALDTKVEKF